MVDIFIFIKLRLVVSSGRWRECDEVRRVRYILNAKWKKISF